jgi:DNA-binding MarR family transcriptional regulator
MNLLVEVKRSLTLLDLVFREWARLLGLDECAVMLVLLLSELGDRSAAELATRCGRRRQQVRRSLLMLERQGRVEVSHLSATGRAHGWSLTEAGIATARCLNEGVAAWTDQLDREVDLGTVASSLERIVALALNRKTSNGWAQGLCEPRELRADSMRNRAEAAGVIAERDSPPDLREPATDPPPRPNNTFTDEERARIDEAWRALWN